MKIKRLDKIVLALAVVTMMAVGVTTSATTHSTTINIGAKTGETGKTRPYTGKGNLKVQFFGTGSANNSGKNKVEPLEVLSNGNLRKCGGQSGTKDFNWTFGNCPTGNYQIYFYNAGTTAWKSDAVNLISS